MIDKNSKVTFNKKAGVYNEPFELELKAAYEHQIYYTLDGSKPTLNSKCYVTPIEISKKLMFGLEINSNVQTSPLREGFSFTSEEVKKAVTVTAASYINDQFSEPVSTTYILDSTLFKSALPVISLIVEPKDFFDKVEGIYVPGAEYKEGNHRTGNCYGRGRAYEKEGSIEFFDSNGTLGFQQKIGIRINGSYTRRLPQKSLRLYPRKVYGQSRIHYQMFEDLPYDTFKRLVLRNSGNDYYSTHIRDGLMHELIKDRGLDVQAYRPSIVLLNGEYWGIHNIREKFTKDYIKSKYNVKKSNLVMMSVQSKNGHYFKIDVGSPKDQTHYDTLIHYVENSDMTHDVHVHYVENLMDITNFFEYVAAQVYYSNTDSFHNNLTIWRKRTSYTPYAPKGHDGRWRWMVFDLDWGMGYRMDGEGDPMTYNMLGHMLSSDRSVSLFRNLMRNERLKMQFIETMLNLLNSNFKTSHVQKKIDKLAAVIRPEIPQSIARWENISSIEAWEENIGQLHRFAEIRPLVIKEHLMQAFGLTKTELDKIEKRKKVKSSTSRFQN